MIQEYLAQYGGTADSMSSDVPEAYSVGQVFAQAVNKIHSINNAALIKEFHNDIFQSAQGFVKFDATGHNQIALPYLFQWQKGKLIPVYPDTIAVETPEYPKPAWP